MTEEQDELQKTFPFFFVWFDKGGKMQCEGTCHARSQEEANELAYTRVLHGSQDSFATIYKGSASGQASRVRTYKWQENKVVYLSR